MVQERDLKLRLIENDIFSDYKKFKNIEYLQFMNDARFQDYLDYNIDVLNTMQALDDKTLKALEQLDNARKQRIKRLHVCVEYMVHFPKKCYFLTLTFNDKTLNNTTRDARHQRVLHYLKTTCDCYVANIDFGEINEREHYHAVVLCSDISKLEKWAKNGFYNAKKVVYNDNSIKALPKYIDKLVNHSFKISTSNYNIYSRGLYRVASLFKDLPLLESRIS